MKKMKKVLVMLVVMMSVGMVFPIIADAATNQGALKQMWDDHHKVGGMIG